MSESILGSLSSLSKSRNDYSLSELKVLYALEMTDVRETVRYLFGSEGWPHLSTRKISGCLGGLKKVERYRQSYEDRSETGAHSGAHVLKTIGRIPSESKGFHTSAVRDAYRNFIVLMKDRKARFLKTDVDGREGKLGKRRTVDKPESKNHWLSRVVHKQGYQKRK